MKEKRKNRDTLEDEVISDLPTKRKYSSDSDSDSSSSQDSIPVKKKKHKSVHKKGKRIKKKSKKKKYKKKESKKKCKRDAKTSTVGGSAFIGPAIPNTLNEEAKRMAPITKEEWEKKQNEIKRVFDEETGRYRLVRGEGEIVEEIVSKERHKAINKLATVDDGIFFQNQLGLNANT